MSTINPKPALMDDSWWEVKAVREEFFSPRMEWMKKVIAEKPFNPFPPENIFRVFKMPLHKVRVVIVGQSPYPNPLDCSGLAFGVPQDRKPENWPFSLRVLAASIFGTAEEAHTYMSATLEEWVYQGVFLYNYALTIPQESRVSEHKKLWEPFTLKVMQTLADQDRRIIFYFLGKDASSLQNMVMFPNRHTIYHSVHPAALAYNPDMQFDGKFQYIKEDYFEIYGTSLDWGLPF